MEERRENEKETIVNKTYDSTLDVLYSCESAGAYPSNFIHILLSEVGRKYFKTAIVSREAAKYYQADFSAKGSFPPTPLNRKSPNISTIKCIHIYA